MLPLNPHIEMLVPDLDLHRIRFSEATERALGGFVTPGCNHTAVMNRLDANELALEEVSKTRADAEYRASKIQRKMRALQQALFEPGMKPTIWERIYKADPDHADLEEALGICKAITLYCHNAWEILYHRYYPMKDELKRAAERGDWGSAADE